MYTQVEPSLKIYLVLVVAATLIDLESWTPPKLDEMTF